MWAASFVLMRLVVSQSLVYLRFKRDTMLHKLVGELSYSLGLGTQ